MGYAIRMGIPEMDELWNTLKTKHRDGTIGKRYSGEKVIDHQRTIHFGALYPPTTEVFGEFFAFAEGTLEIDFSGR